MRLAVGFASSACMPSSFDRFYLDDNRHRLRCQRCHQWHSLASSSKIYEPHHHHHHHHHHHQHNHNHQNHHQHHRHRHRHQTHHHLHHSHLHHHRHRASYAPYHAIEQTELIGSIESMVRSNLTRLCGKLSCCINSPETVDSEALKTIQGEIKIQAENGETRVLRSAPDWTESAINADHLWVSTSTSGGDLCYVGERECSKTGPRLCCPACKVTAHTGCISTLIDKLKIHCKPTFKDGVRQYREQPFVKHHWVHRRHEKGRCKACGKSFQSKLSFGGNKEIVAISCSWCKAAYHNKNQCYTEQLLGEACEFGNYAQIVVPPTWIVKLPRKGSFKSSIRRTPRNKRLSSKRRSSGPKVKESTNVGSTAAAAATAHAAATSSSSNAERLHFYESNPNSASSDPISGANQDFSTNCSNRTLASFGSSSNMLSSSSSSSVIPNNDANDGSNSLQQPFLARTNISSLRPPALPAPSSSTSASSLSANTSNMNTANTTTCSSNMITATATAQNSGNAAFTTATPSLSHAPHHLPHHHHHHHNHHHPHTHSYAYSHLHYQHGKHNQSGNEAVAASGYSPSSSSSSAFTAPTTTTTTATNTTSNTTGAVGQVVRRNYRRHSHAAVSASSLSANLLSAESNNESQQAAMAAAAAAAAAASHFLHTVHRSFAIKPIPSANLKPLLVFINPKSGGNQGAKLMQKFQWHLNPRQVFDLSQGGPKLGLDLYKKVHNLRILACGGDGTAGWVLSTIDEIGIQPPPPISVLPLGTGNDLARSFNWGGSYTDEPVSKILCNIQEGEVVQLDRWNLRVQRNPAIEPNANLDEAKGAKPDLPLNVVNNYFSIGVDAHIALSFHEAREAHPERFNSRLRNRMFYGQAGGKDLLQRKWKDLCNYVNLECDGVDLTPRLRELKVHSVLFLNIPSYGGGTRPWAGSSSHEPQCTHDGKIEVIGLTTYQLPLLQAGGHGTCIAQCKSAKITTTRTIPMQVDGEPCRLLPSIINLELRNKANLIAKTKSIAQHRQMPTLEKITLKVRKLNLADYEAYHYDKERLRELSTLLGTITIEQNLELIHVRTRINDLMKEKGLCVVGATDCAAVIVNLNSAVTGASPTKSISTQSSTTQFHHPPASLMPTSSATASASSSSASNKFVSNDWCFVDSCTAERFFRIDRAQEHLHYVVDICNEDLYILDPQFEDKDYLDMLTSEEVIADLGVSGGPGSIIAVAAAAAAAAAIVADETDQISSSQSLLTQNSDRADNVQRPNSSSDNQSLTGSSFSSGAAYNIASNDASSFVSSSSVAAAASAVNTAVYQLNGAAANHSKSTSSIEACSSIERLFPTVHSASSLSQNPNNNSKNNNNSNPQQQQQQQQQKLLRPDLEPLPITGISTRGSSNLTLLPVNHNGSISAISPGIHSSSLIMPPAAYTIDSPPRSPRRRQKPQSYAQQEELMLAAQNGDVSLLKQLHHKGANLMMADEKGMSALHHAVINGNENAVSFLLNAFTPEMVDLADREQGQTALHKAVLSGHPNICTMLVIRGATLNVKDRQGRSAQELAQCMGQHDLAAALSHIFRADNRETTV